MSQSWYAIQSKPNREAFLSSQLLHRKIEVFYPQLQVEPVNPRSRKIKPFFPGYMFVRVDLEEVPITSLIYIPGARSVVCFDHEPAAIPDEVIQGIEKNVKRINQQQKSSKDALMPGDPVMILDGPFKGYEAIFDTRIKGSDRVRLLVRLLHGQQKKVQVPARITRPKHS
jgi:transcriptional antiterminator RfaH